ncbi:hypothetical protein [Brevibacillus choshinensis]|uniref:hypothetical protein n=1 Tax=Brevibacillus choshinensis TaxID=54911 RepID=UPI002E1C5812|nr:hypothetical protein [Brevibacillus choshinensis]
MDKYEIREANLQKLRECGYVKVSGVEQEKKRDTYVDNTGNHFAMISRYKTRIVLKPLVQITFENGEEKEISLDDSHVVEAIINTKGDIEQVEQAEIDGWENILWGVGIVVLILWWILS